MDKFLKYLPLGTLLTVIGIGIGIAKWVIEEAQSRKDKTPTWIHIANMNTDERPLIIKP